MTRRPVLSAPGTGRAVTIWMEASILQQLEELAMQHESSRSTLARQIIVNFLNTSEDKTSIA